MRLLQPQLNESVDNLRLSWSLYKMVQRKARERSLSRFVNFAQLRRSVRINVAKVRLLKGCE